jgi:hypothetical protein
VADDPKYQKFLEELRKVLQTIVDDWDKWRLKHREGGDPENPRVSKEERASRGLYNAVVDQYRPHMKSATADKVDRWVEDLSEDAAFNFGSYAECFVAENLVRKYIRERKIPLSLEAKEQVSEYKKRESESKNAGNVSIDIRKTRNDLSYLDIKDMANMIDKRDPNREACLPRDAREFKPMRDAVAHTALLSDQAKARLASVRENIKGRIRTLLSDGA